MTCLRLGLFPFRSSFFWPTSLNSKAIFTSTSASVDFALFSIVFVSGYRYLVNRGSSVETH